MIEILDIYFKDSYKDMIVDCLLSDGLDNFYYFDCKKYSSKLLLSAKEKVTGRIDYGKFEVFVDEDIKDRLIHKLYAMIGKENLRIYAVQMEEK